MNNEIYKFCSCSNKDESTMATFSPNDNSSITPIEEKKAKNFQSIDNKSAYVDPDQETTNEPQLIEETLNYPDGSEYSGQTMHKMRNGKGIYKDKNGIPIYEGQWKDDNPHGEGKMLVNSEMLYIGEFVYGVKTGKGKITSLNEANVYYEGKFINGEKHEFGQEKFPDNSIYIGEYFKGKRQGKGKYYFENNTFYEGDFLDDKIHGKVII